jgi:hypothetical protein
MLCDRELAHNQELMLQLTSVVAVTTAGSDTPGGHALDGQSAVCTHATKESRTLMTEFWTQSDEVWPKMKSTAPEMYEFATY